MKKSINLWAFPYPQKMSLKQCFELAKDAGFDGVEINFALEGEFSPQSSEAQIHDDRQAGRRRSASRSAASARFSTGRMR